MKRNSGKAKVFGTLTCVIGAVVLSLYKGMPLISTQHSTLNHGKPKRFGLGSAVLSAGSVAWSCWFLIQTRIGQKFPYKYTSTLIMSFFCAAQSTALGFITNRNTSKWILKGELQILSIVYGVSSKLALNTSCTLSNENGNFLTEKLHIDLHTGHGRIRSMLCSHVLVCETKGTCIHRCL